MKKDKLDVVRNIMFMLNVFMTNVQDTFPEIKLSTPLALTSGPSMAEEIFQKSQADAQILVINKLVDE